MADKCEGLCELEYVDCTLSCSDTNCLVECGRTLSYCLEGNWKSQCIKILWLALRLPVQYKLSERLLRLSKSDMCLWRESYTSKQTQFGDLPKGTKCWFGVVHHWMQQWSRMREFMCCNFQSTIRKMSLSGKTQDVFPQLWNINYYAFLRTNVLLDVHVILSTANQTKNQFWFWTLSLRVVNQFSSNIMVSHYLFVTGSKETIKTSPML